MFREYCGVQCTYLDRVPILAGEGVHGLLLEALLALRESLVPIVKQSVAIFDRDGVAGAHFPTAMIVGSDLRSWRKGTMMLDGLVEGRNNFNCVCLALGLSELRLLEKNRLHVLPMPGPSQIGKKAPYHVTIESFCACLRNA